MVTAEMTEGMTSIEVLVVLLCAAASSKELARLRTFINTLAQGTRLRPAGGKPEHDTPESAAEKARMARKVGDMFRGLK